MPSDFISLLSSDLDLDLESPRCLYLRESVYDLLPKELQLPPSREASVAAMSQTSGGEASEVGSPPPAVVAADASSSSSSTGGVHSTSVTDRKAMQVESCSLTAGVSSRGVSEKQSTNKTVQQSSPMRWRVLSISPPPEDLLDNSQMSCQDEGTVQESEPSSSMWMDDSTSNFSNMSTRSYNDNTEVPRKSRKRNTKQRPGIKQRESDESNMDVFDADSAKAPHYVLSQLTSDSKGNAQAGNGSLENQKTQVGKKSPTLCGQYPSKSEGKELKIVVQPETQHRARYLTEGSRGSVKDRTQQGFPTVKLEGHNEPVVLQVFVANDSGRVKPHGFYQACKVTGRNTTPCKEVDIEGTTVIEVNLDPSNMMALAVDCVGILKLRNADVEARIGIAGSKKKSTRARLVFRVNIARNDGSVLTLQTPSSPILCTQPAGLPEILKKSLHNCTVKGEEEVFLIGKNFLKGAKVLFQENISDEDSWKAEAEIDMELFHQNHLVVKVPPYQDLEITSPVSVGIYVITNAGRSHEVHPFTYTPDPCVSPNILVKKELAISAQSCSFENNVKATKATGCNMETGSVHPRALTVPLIQAVIVKSEDVDPMELTAESVAASIYKAVKVGNSQQPLENISGNGAFSPSVSHLDNDNAPIKTKETMSPLQTQDITQQVPLQRVTAPSQHQSNEPFLQQPTPFPGRDSQSGEVLQAEAAVANLPQMTELSQQQQRFEEQAQSMHQQLASSMFSSANDVNQLQNTIHQMQTGSFPSSPVTSNSGNVDLVQQVFEAEQQLSAVLFSGPGSSESTQTVQDQMNTGIFQQVTPIQNSVHSGMFSSTDTAAHSRPESISGRSENVHQKTDNSLPNQPQAMDTSSSLVMGMQQAIHQTAGPMQSDLFSSSSTATGSIQQSPVYRHGSHIMSGLSPSDDLHMQCDLFSPSSLHGNENNASGQRVSTTNSSLFQASVSPDGKNPSGQAKQMQGNIFQTMVQMEHSGENQPQVNLFTSSEMMAVQTGDAQQQGARLFQQAEEMMTLQSGNFMQQPSNVSQTTLYHTTNPIGDTPNASSEPQGSLFHSPNPIDSHQNPVSSPDQLQPPLYHSQSNMSVLQTTSASADHQSTHLFISQNPLNSLQNNATSQEKQLTFFSNQNSHNALQAATNTEQQSTFQQQTQMSHIQGPILSQEQQQPQQSLFQSQHQSQQSLFQSQQQPQQGMFQSQQQPQQDMFQSLQQPQQDVFQSRQQTQQDLFQAQQQPPQDLFQAQQQPPQDLFQAQQQPPQDLFQPQQQPPQDLFQAQQQPPENMFQAQQQSPQDLFQAQQQQPQDIFQSQPQPPQDLFQSQQQPSQDLFQSQQQPPRDVFQSQQQTQQDLFQSQQHPQPNVFKSLQSSQQELYQSPMSLTHNQQGSIFQTQHSMIGIQSSSGSQEQGIVFSNQNTMASQEQHSMLYTNSQGLMANQEPNCSMFHVQNRTSMNQDEQPMQFQGQSSVTPIPNSGSSQSEQQQSSLFHNSPQIQMVQGSSGSREQQVTLFISSASLSALQSSINQQELQQSNVFSSGSNIGSIQGNTTPSQQQTDLFHSTAGSLNQMQNSPTSSQQTSGMFLFGIQNNCGQLLSPAQATVPDQLMAINQEGQAEDEEQSVTCLNQHMPENSSHSSSVSSNQEMEKINDLIVSLQSQGNSLSGSF